MNNVSSVSKIFPALSERKPLCTKFLIVFKVLSMLTVCLLVEEWSYFHGDRIEVLTGKDKGKQGIIAQVIPERNWVICEGTNWHYRIVGKEKEFPGIYIRSEAPLRVDRVIRLVDPSDLKETDFELRFTEDGEKVPVSIRSGRIIPIPEANNQTHDYKTKAGYLEREKDTPAFVVGEA